MDKYKNWFNSSETERKTIGIGKKFFLSATIWALTNADVFSQNQNGLSKDALLNYWFWGGLALIFLLISVIIIRKAILVLNENGRSVEFTFPIFRGTAKNTRAVAIIIFIVVLSGILWATGFGS
ncbi:MAG: hypothetical protein AB7O73_12595 [Bacteroidia bacterium]